MSLFGLEHGGVSLNPVGPTCRTEGGMRHPLWWVAGSPVSVTVGAQSGGELARRSAAMKTTQN